MPLWLTLGFGAFVATCPSLRFFEKFADEVKACPKHCDDDQDLLYHFRRKFGR